MGTTVFTLLVQICGLSLGEAATFLGVRLDTVKSWSAGRNPTPGGALGELAALAERIEDAADAALDEIARLAAEHGAPETIELGIAVDDHEAQSLGWPCVGAHRAVLARVVAAGTADGQRFAVVPRGSTPVTAAAADAREVER